LSKNLLALSDLGVQEIQSILDEAQFLRETGLYPRLEGKVACNLFFESSTRTQYSFCVAQNKMGMRVVSFNPASSSMNKGETFYDTVKVFDSLGVDVMVIRHQENEYYRELLGHIRAPLVNGGDGTGNHPTQSLLDLLTIRQEFGRFEGLKVSIIGDVRYSRVARTNYEVMRRLGMEVVIAGPEEFLTPEYPDEDVDKAIATSDVVMMLRIQKERQTLWQRFTEEQYHSAYGLTAERVNKMKEKAIILHPAPFNRGVEIASEVVECDKSRIFRQMENGVFVRMAAIRRAVED